VEIVEQPDSILREPISEVRQAVLKGYQVYNVSLFLALTSSLLPVPLLLPLPFYLPSDLAFLSLVDRAPRALLSKL